MKKRLSVLLLCAALLLALFPAAGAANVYDARSGVFPEFDSALGYHMTAVGGKKPPEAGTVPTRSYAAAQEISLDDCVDYLREYIDLLVDLGTFEVVRDLKANSAGDRYTAFLRYTGAVETRGSLLAMRADRTWPDWGPYHMTLTAEYSEYRRANLHSTVEVEWDSALTPVSTDLRTPSGARLGQDEDSQIARDNRLPQETDTDAAKPGPNWDSWAHPFADDGGRTPGDATVTAPEAPDATVVLGIGYNKMCAGRQVTPVDAANEQVCPVLLSDRTLVPVSRIVDAFGGVSTWDGATRGTTFTLGIHTVTHQVGQKTISVDGRTVTMDLPSRIIQDRTYVPARYILEGLGLWVGYEPTYKLVVVSTRNLQGQDLVDLPESQRLFASEPIPDYPRSIDERYATDGMEYVLAVGQALTLFNPRQAIGDYYAYTWEVVDGGELVHLDPDGPTCRFYAKRPGTVIAKAHLDETIVLSLGHYDNDSYTRTFTITIRPNSGSTGGGSLMTWQTCPSCGGTGVIRSGTTQFTCPTCQGQKIVLR